MRLRKNESPMMYLELEYLNESTINTSFYFDFDTSVR